MKNKHTLYFLFILLTINNILAQTTYIITADDSAPITLHDNAIFVVDAGQSYILSGVISGNYSITKTGGGTLVLTAENTYTGTTTIEEGTLQIGDAGGTGSISGAIDIGAGGTLVFHRNDNSVNLDDIVISNTLSGSGNMIFRGTNTINQSSYKFTGSSTSFTGTLNIEGGARLILQGSASGATNAITVENGSTIYLAASHTYSNPLTIAGNGWQETAGQLGVLRLGDGANFAGSVALTEDSRIGIRNAGATISGPINGAFGIEKYDDGRLTLSGANTYTGATIVTAGTLFISGNGSVEQSAGVSVVSGATFDISNITSSSASIKELSGAGSVVLGAKDMTVGNANTSTIFSGTISGTGGITKTGAGSLTLTGANTFTGTTTLNAGELLLGNSAALTQSPVILTTGTTLGTTTSASIYSLTANGSTIDPTGTLSINTNTSLDNAIINIALSLGNISDKINITNSVSYGTNNTIINLTSWQTGSFVIMSATNGLDANKYTLQLNGIPIPADYSTVLSVSGNDLILTTTKNISSSDITIDDIPSVTYSGQPQTPALTIKDNGTLLTENTDYILNYGTDNINAGSVTVTITGIGTYSGTTTKNFEIKPKNITVTALGGSSTYGDRPINPGISCNDLVNGETVSVLTGLSNSFGITSITAASTRPYILTVTGRLTNTNYTVVHTIDGLWVVNPKDITVTALGGSSIYGDSPTNPGISCSDLVNGETVSVLTGLSNSFGITSSTTASTTPYTLTVTGSLTNMNYTISSIVDGFWTVNLKSISVTADDKTKNFGQPNPTFTYRVNPALINGDQMSGELTCTKEAVGQWPILQGTLTAGSNYTITYTSGTLTILSTSTDITAITVNGETANRSGNNFAIMTACGEDEAVIDVIADKNATVTINGVEQNPYTLNLSNYGNNTTTITVTAQNGTSQTYTLTVNKPIPFSQAVKMRWNNTLTVINNPAENGGYIFTSYKWFRNGQQISTEQSWSAGADGTKLNPADLFYVELTTSGVPETLRTCETTVSLRSLEIKAYPNPVSSGQILYVEADVDDEQLKDAVIEVYSVTGNYLGQMKMEGRLTPVDIHYATGVHFFVFKGKDGFTKELKVVVQ